MKSDVQIPKPVMDHLIAVRDRVKQIVKEKGSVAKYGKPIINSKDELIAIIYGMMQTSPYEVANIIGVDKTTTYKWYQMVKEGKPIKVFEDGKVVEYVFSFEDVKKIVEDEWLKPRDIKYISDVMQSKVVLEFIHNPIKIQKTSKHGSKYNLRQIRQTINVLSRVIDWINRNRDRYPNLPSNPDLWNKEVEPMLVEAILDMIRSTIQDRAKQEQYRYITFTAIRRIPRFYQMGLFDGYVGAMKNVFTPKDATLFYEHFLQLKKMYYETDDNELKAFILIAFLHIWSGAREGWGALIEMECARLSKTSEEYSKCTDDVRNRDLDDPSVSISLIGIKWSKAIYDKSGRLVGFKIFESKTGNEWELRYRWLDNDLVDELEKIRVFAEKNNIDSVVKSILLYYDVKPNGKGKYTKWTVGAFRNWYTNWVKKLRKMLNLPWSMNPHRLRSAHISILAQLKIPMEIALSNIGFGVGWFSLDTAMRFYLRFSESLINEYLANAEELKKKYSI